LQLVRKRRERRAEKGWRLRKGKGAGGAKWGGCGKKGEKEGRRGEKRRK